MPDRHTNKGTDQHWIRRLCRRINPYCAAIVVFVVSMGVSSVISHTQFQIAEAKIEAELDDDMRTIGSEIIGDLKHYKTPLQILRGYHLSSEKVEQHEWLDFSRHASLTNEYPGCFGFSFVRKVPIEESDEYMREMREEIPGYTRKNPIEADLVDSEDHWIIVQYTSPESNFPTLGLDLSTKSINRAMYEQAAMSNSFALSPPMHLSQTGLDRWGLVMAIPVYDQDVEELSPSERLDACVGWVACPIGIDEFFAGGTRASWESYCISLRAVVGMEKETELFTTRGDHCAKELPNTTLSFVIGGQPFVLWIEPKGPYSGPIKQRAKMYTLLSFTLSLVLTLIVFLSSLTSARARAMALEMTHSLREEQAQNKALAERANSANKAKTGFLANMSHEIRTPLTAVLGYSEVLEDQIRSDTEEDELIRSINCIRQSGEHLRSIINDILDLSKIDAGKIDIQPSTCDVVELVREVVGSFEVRAQQKKLDLVVEVDGRVPGTVRMDGFRVRQVLINLINNAIKFTDTGSVTIIVGHDGEQLEFAVRDTGVGIPEEMMGRLFRPFEQADNSVTRQYEGTGLGLSISQKIARLMHGAIEVESVRRGGSTFTFRFPAKGEQGTDLIDSIDLSKGPLRAETSEKDEPNRGRVLLVEDGVENQRLISHFLRRAGFEFEIASNGKIASEMLTRDDRFDVILMDMQMPVLDGYTTARLLRERGNSIPIIALTAHVMEGDREKCIEAGCTDYLSKPLDREKMISMIRGYAGPGTRGMDAA